MLVMILIDVLFSLRLSDYFKYQMWYTDILMNMWFLLLGLYRF